MMSMCYADLRVLLSTMRKQPGGITAVARAIRDSNNPELIGFIQTAIRSDDNLLRCEALDLLSRVAPLIALGEAISFLSSANVDLRRVGCEIIEEIGDLSAEPALLQCLTTESNPSVRFAAVSALRTTGTTRCLPVLAALAESDSSTDFEGRPISELVPRVTEAILSRTS
jgi:Pretoxin HINT domain/HEAT repeats